MSTWVRSAVLMHMQHRSEQNLHPKHQTEWLLRCSLRSRLKHWLREGSTSPGCRTSARVWRQTLQLGDIPLHPGLPSQPKLPQCPRECINPARAGPLRGEGMQPVCRACQQKRILLCPEPQLPHTQHCLRIIQGRRKRHSKVRSHDSHCCLAVT